MFVSQDGYRQKLLYAITVNLILISVNLINFRNILNGASGLVNLIIDTKQEKQQ